MGLTSERRSMNELNSKKLRFDWLLVKYTPETSLILVIIQTTSFTVSPLIISNG